MHKLCFALLFCLTARTYAELFTAVAEVEFLLETHKRLIEDLDFYNHQEEKRLFTLKKYLKQFKKEYNKAMEDIPNYLGNPIKIFSLTNRLTMDLECIKDNIALWFVHVEKLTTKHKDLKYPTKEDLAGAAQAIVRLQETYHLNVKELAQGVIYGVTYSKPMTASDCYELGRVLHKKVDYTNVGRWMIEAFHKYYKEKKSYHFTEVDILEYIIFAYFSLRDTQSALQWTYKLLHIDPKNSRAKSNVPLYHEKIAKEKKMKMHMLSEQFIDPQTEGRKAYEKLCRGEMVVPIEISSRLRCRYLNKNNNFLRIAPVKMEMIYLNLDIVLFYNVLSDDEIKAIKSVASPVLNRAGVFGKNDKAIPAQYRISKSAWLHDAEHETAARISRRVTDLTDLSMDTAELLQVVNYGIGGHYEPHYDFMTNMDNNDCSKNGGNRIATILFYMSDVTFGGATVFPELNVSIHPKKGAAAFWYNLKPSGNGDLATVHGACPVLLGTKWVCNKWIHTCGQELLKPCGLPKKS